MDSTPPTSQTTAGADTDARAAVVSASEPAVIETRVMAVPPQENAVPCGCGAGHAMKVVRFESLARCGDEIWIENEGQLYRLRKTRQGKLILTK